MKNTIFAAVLALALLFAGCAYKSQSNLPSLPGSDRDSHGCIISAGYEWCAPLQKCIRAWEENCTAQMVGNDTDSHGCIPSAGYEWCEGLGKCIRPWEENCTSPTNVRILTEEFPPYSFKSSSGAVDGRSTGIVRLILNGLGQTGKIEVMSWPDAYSLALSEPNVALYSAVRSTQRERLFKWVGPIGTFDKTIFAKNGSGVRISNLEAAKKSKSICVVQNDERQQMLVGLGFANLVVKGNDSACMQSLASGETELWFGSTDTAPYVAASAGVAQGTAVPALKVEKTEIYIAFSDETSDEVVAKWQSALDKMKRDGFYDSYMDFWGANMTPGSDIDSHGCIGSAGYDWCDTLQVCARPWETPCPGAILVGNDSDEHGCKGSAGYTWCPEKSRCLRVWEDSCPSVEQSALEAQAKTHCAAGSTVFTCGKYVKVVSDMPGAGSKYYALGNYGEPVSCPIVAPDYMSAECKSLMLNSNCTDKKIC